MHDSTPPSSIAALIASHRAIVCVGTGGVGKTTTAATLGVAAAMAGKKTMVITIDPARQLARALGLSSLKRGGEPVPRHAIEAAELTLKGELHAGMLDQKGAWDAFIGRHTKDEAVRTRLFENPFYQQLSTSFAGSTEYMAVEELCHIDESGEYDLIIVDTPPAGHAVDFLRAPERIEKLLDPEVAKWLSVPYRALGSSGLAVGRVTVNFVIKQLEKAMGSRTVSEISAFFLALEAIFGNLAERAARARALLLGPGTAFVLVASPRARVLADGLELATVMRGLGVPLKGAIINRMHPWPDDGDPAAAVEQALAGGEPQSVRWLTDLARAARAQAVDERARLTTFRAQLPPGTVWAEVPELDHDAHSLKDLAEVARRLGATPPAGA